MRLILLLLSTNIIIKYKVVCAITENEVNYLQENFFNSLQNDPKLQDSVLTKEKKNFIDAQIDSFIRLTKTSQGIKKTKRQKRSFPVDDLESLTQDKYGVFVLDSVEAKFSLETEFARDIMIFEQNGEWYAAALESDEVSTYGNKLRLYQKFGESFEMIHELGINKGLRLSLRCTLKGTFLAVAENRSESGSKSKIFMFQLDGTLKEVQTLNTCYVSDIIMWQQNDEVFMAVSQEMQIISNQTSYETTTLVYKWLGEHFDQIQSLITYNAQKIATFNIGNSHFLAIANSRNDRGERNIFSEIFKYDLDTQSFLPHQRIASKSAMDIKFFGFIVENFQETFLVIANYFDEECNEESTSIVYKYVDDYFIPFQSMEVSGATGWLPVNGPHGEFVLLASSASYGIKIFQYNGWRFVESKVQYNKGVFGPGVTSMHQLIYNKKVFVVVSNQKNDGEQAEVFQLNFIHRNELKEYHDKTLSWCKSTLNSLQMEEVQREIVGQPGRSDMPDSVVSPSEFFGESQELNNFNEENKRISLIQSHLDTQSFILQNFDAKLLEVLQPTFAGDVFAKEVIVNNDVSIQHLSTRALNNVSMHDFITNVMKISDFHTKQALNFSDLTVSRLLQPSLINGKPAKTLLHTTDNIKSPEVVISRTAIFKSPIKLQGQINDISVTNRTILLNRGNQYLPGQLKSTEISAINFDTPKINKMDLSILQNLSLKSLKLENIGNLTVKRLTLMGLLNGVDITVADKFSLKTHGDQKISGHISFDNLEVNSFKAKLPFVDDFIRTYGGEYWVKHDVQFNGDITAKNVKIENSLNQIPVNNKGQLDVLLKDSSELQFINGFKEIQAVKLGDVKFRGKILSKLLEKINPVQHIRKSIVVNRNFTFRKGVVIEKFLQAKDVGNIEGSVSIERLHHEGVKIYDEEIPIHLQLLQQVKVDNINANKINGRDANAFAVTGTNDLQIISGSKLIPSNLSVIGSTEVLNINSINLKDLQTTTMKIKGNQILSGKLVIQNLTAHAINTSISRMGEKLWSNILTIDQDQIVAGKTILKNLKAGHFESTFLFCDGHINNYNFSNLEQDTITYSNLINISSRKHFINLTIEKLIVEENEQFQEVFDFIQLFENAVLPTAEVESVTFDGVCNQMTNKAFSDSWFLRFNDDLNFENITVLDALHIDSDYINNLKIEDLVHKTIKKDESFHFKSAIFDNVLYSAKPVILKGEVLGVNLADLSNSRYKNAQENADVFNEINVNGSVFFHGLVSGFNITELCSFAFGNNENKELFLEGPTLIKEDLETQFLNKNDINKVKQHAWFKNKPTQFIGYITFDEINFLNNITCYGYVGGISLKYLTDNYFSRTANQTVSASIEFVDVLFHSGVQASSLELAGDVNALHLEEFLGTALLDGMDQLFEQTAYLDESTIKKLGGEYLVNEMDLQSEVMRYDKDNIVTGSKQLKDVKVDLMEIDGRTMVQNVPLDFWIKNSILKTGRFNVTGTKTFNGPLEFRQGIHVHGPFNGVFVDAGHTMLKSLAQNITGKKTFVQAGQKLIQFKNVYLSGQVNEIDLRKLIGNQVYRNEDTVINSTVKFSRDVSAIDVSFDKLYNGLNVTEFVKNVTHFAELNNIQVALQNLLTVAYNVQESLKGQAVYLSTYTAVKEFYQSNDVVPVLFADGMHRLAAVYEINGTTAVIFHTWDSHTQGFVKTQKVQYQIKPAYTTALQYHGGDYFYIEGYSSINEEYVAEISQFANDTSFIRKKLPTWQVKSMTSFTLPYSDEKCIVAVFWNAIPVTIACNIYTANPEIFNIDETGAIQVTTIIIENILYVIIINLNAQSEEPSVNLWKYNAENRQFHLDQTMYVARPNSVAAIFYKSSYHIAISSGHVPHTLYTGSIEMYKYDSTIKQFGHHQSIQLNAPIQVEFAVLPSQELVLFSLTESSSKPLVVYEYSGISGFSRKIVASGITQSVSMRHFTTADQQHFVVLRLINGAIAVFKAVFKGQLYEE